MQEREGSGSFLRSGYKPGRDDKGRDIRRAKTHTCGRGNNGGEKNESRAELAKSQFLFFFMLSPRLHQTTCLVWYASYSLFIRPLFMQPTPLFIYRQTTCNSHVILITYLRSSPQIKQNPSPPPLKATPEPLLRPYHHHPLQNRSPQVDQCHSHSP